MCRGTAIDIVRLNSRIIDNGSRTRSHESRAPPLIDILAVDGAVYPDGEAVPAARRVLPMQPDAVPVRARHEAVLVRHAVGRLSSCARVEYRVAAEQLEEEPLELLPEYHVDDEVDAGVDCDEEVADFHQLTVDDAVEGFQDVVD